MYRRFRHSNRPGLLVGLLVAACGARADTIEEVVVRAGSGVNQEKLVGVLDAAAPPVSLADLIRTTPGASLVGQGGRLQTFALRGLSQDRIRVIVNHAPLRGLRRAGVSAAFLRPEWMSTLVKVESDIVAQGTGTGAGTVNAVPRADLTSLARISYEHPDNRRTLSTTVAGPTLSGGVAWTKADDAHAADGTRLNSGYQDLSLLLDRRASGDRHRNHTTLLVDDARNIGKSNSDYPERATSYPRDQHLFLSHTYERTGTGTLMGWVYAQRLDTDVLEDEATTRVGAETIDYGLRIASTLTTAAGNGLRWGVDLFGRGAFNVEETGTATLDNGRELELGAFLAGSVQEGGWWLDWGGRLAHGEADARGQRGTRTTEPLGHLRIGWVTDPLLWQVSASRIATFPSVSELFVTGTTGRGAIIGNDQLKAETGWIYEASMASRVRRVESSLGLFYMDIDNFIERIALRDNHDTFGNAAGGRIYGIIGAIRYATDTFDLSANFTALRGELDTGEPVRDVPNHEFSFLARLHPGEATLTLQIDQRLAGDRVAVGNREADARTLWSISFRQPLSERLTVDIFGRNLFDELYYETNDGKSALGAERTVGITFSASL